MRWKMELIITPEGEKIILRIIWLKIHDTIIWTKVWGGRSVSQKKKVA